MVDPALHMLLQQVGEPRHAKATRIGKRHRHRRLDAVVVPVAVGVVALSEKRTVRSRIKFGSVQPVRGRTFDLG